MVVEVEGEVSEGKEERERERKKLRRRQVRVSQLDDDDQGKGERLTKLVSSQVCSVQRESALSLKLVSLDMEARQQRLA